MLAVVLAYAGLMGAWVVTNPPGFAPDEPAHYVKAVAAGRGDLLGEPAHYDHLPVVNQAMLQWLNRTSRSLSVPGALRSCPNFRLPVYGRCPEGRPPTAARDISYVGTYPAYLYLWPGGLMRWAANSDVALLLGRAAVATLSNGLLGAAAWTLWWRRQTLSSLLGLALAITPMVIFLGSELSASGPEVAAAICFAACLLRLADRGHAPPRWLWITAALSGVILASARSSGPLWIVADLVWFLALTGRRPWRRPFFPADRWARFTVAGIGTAALATVAWEALVEPRIQLSPHTVMTGVGFGLTNLGQVLRHSVGVFGWIDVPMPSGAYLVWGATMSALIVAAAFLGRGRERVTLAVVAAESLLATLAVAVLIRATADGFAMQGRYVLAFLVTLPLVAGEIVYRHRLQVRMRPLTVAIVTSAAAVHVVAWLSNSRYYATNTQARLSFIAPLPWSPPFGWAPWAALVCLSALALTAAGLLGAAGRSGQRTPQVPQNQLS